MLTIRIILYIHYIEYCIAMRCISHKLRLSLLCSKVYLLFFPKFPKILTHYSYHHLLFLIILVDFIVSMIIMSKIHMVTVTLENRMMSVQTFLQKYCSLQVHLHHNHHFKQSQRSFHYIYPL